MNYENLLSSDAFWTVNKALTRAIGLEAAALVADLYSKRAYFRGRNMLDKDGGFFNHGGEISESFGFGKNGNKLNRIKKKLVAEGILRITRRGVPPKHWFYINDERLAEIITSKNTETVILNSPDQCLQSHQNGGYINKNKKIRIKNKNILNDPEIRKELSWLSNQLG